MTTMTGSIRGRTGTARKQDRLDGSSVVEVAIVAAFVVALVSVLGVPSRSATPQQTCTVRVAEGETLWSLARRHPVAGQTTADTVETIKAINGLEDSLLAEGSLVRVPSTIPGGLSARR